MRRRPLDLLALEDDLAGLGFQLTGDHVEQRCLAGAVRADQTDDLVLPAAQGHALDCDQAAELHDQISGFQYIFAHCYTCSFLAGLRSFWYSALIHLARLSFRPLGI